MKKVSIFLFLIIALQYHLYSQVTLGVQDFETIPATPTMGITTSSNSTFSSGTSFAPNGDNSHVAEGTLGLINNTDGVSTIIEFDPVDVSAYVNVLVSVRVAALSEVSNNGMDGGDFLTLEISTDNGATYSEEITLKGVSNAKWGFTTGTGIASVNYDGDNAASEFKPASGGVRTTDGYSTLHVENITPTTNLKIRITFEDNNADEQWAIDEVKVTGETGVGFTAKSSTPNETSSGSTTHQISITKVDVPLSDISVEITDIGTGTATMGSGNDYEFSTSSITFTTAENYPSTKTIDITIHDDTEVENDETIVLNLALTSGISDLYNLTHTLYIYDNDCALDVMDNFTDGDLTNTPSWADKDNQYSIITDVVLPNGHTVTDLSYLGSNANIGKSTLMTSSSNTSEWEFSLASGEFNPSSTNYFGVILMSDTRFSGDLTALSWDGYYLRIGASGSSDQIDLYRMNGSFASLVGTFSTTTYGTGALENGVDIKVTRDNNGTFELFYRDYAFNYITPPTTSAGTLTDNMHTSSCYFGIFTRFNNASANRRVFIDNINDNTDIVLPVELTSFTAQPINNKIELNWKTLSETNNAYFAIERSTDGQFFEEIGRIDGNGTTLEAKEYTSIDATPERGVNYYRLKQVDFNDRFEYSKVVTASLDKNIQKDIQIIPNLVKEQFNIIFPSASNEAIHLNIYNINGQKIQSETIQNTNKIHIINVNTLNKGLYVITLETSTSIVNRRFVKQ